MVSLGDFDASAVIYGKFTTYRPSTGATFTLGGTPVLSVYKDNSTTQSTTGVTLTADFDSVTGLNHFAVDTSADGTFYSAGSFFDVVITTGTVDSVSVTGSVVASFTIRKNSALKPATAGRTLVVDASGLADANTVKIGPTGSGTAQTAKDVGGAVPAAAAGASGGLLISGSNSGTTTLAALTVTGSMTVSDGLLVSRSTSNTSAITATGNGTGHGILATSGSGATGDGIKATAASTNGNGLSVAGNGTAAGLLAAGGTTGNGLKVVGGGTSGDGLLITATSGHGISTSGTGTTKHGIHAAGGATTSHGINAVGGGVGHGILATSGAGATGDGFRAFAASTNGHGLNLAGNGTGAGLFSTAGNTGNGLKVVGGATSGDSVLITATSGHGISTSGAGTTKHGIHAAGGATTSHGINAVGGGVGHGILATSGGGSTGDGIRAVAASTDGNGLNLAGVGTGAGALSTGGLTGIGLSVVGGGTSGDGIKVVTTSGHGLNLAPVGTSMHGLLATGGNGGTSDGIKAVAGTGGVPIRGDITGNITGTLATLTTYTGNTPQTGDSYARLGAPAGASVSADVAAIKSDTGAIKTKTDSLTFTVAGVVDANALRVGGTTQTARDLGASVLLSSGTGTGQLDFTSGVVKANATQFAGQTITAAAGVTIPSSIASPTNITAGTITTVTNLTNAPTNGDFTATMKASINTEADTALSDVGLTGTVTGRIDATISTRATQTSVDAVKAVTDKVDTTLQVHSGSPGEYRFTAEALELAPTGPSASVVAGAVWDEVLSGHLTAGSTGYALNAAGSAGDPWGTSLPGAYSAGQAGYIVGTNLNATVSSRATQTSVDTIDDFLDTEIAAIKAKTDNLPASPAAVGDIPTATANADALLNRDMSAVSDTNSRSPLNALRFVRNKWQITGTTLSVKKEDDSTEAWSATVSTTPGADPVTGNDPA